MHWHFHGLFDRPVLNTGLSHLDPAPAAEVKGKKLELVDKIVT